MLNDMGKVYCINGGVLATTGNLYTRNIYAGDGRCPEGAVIITPVNGIHEICNDSGSMFDTYYVKEFVTASGIDVGNIFAFKDIYQFTVDSYEQNRNYLSMLLAIPPKDEHLKQIFYQQQFAHVFSLLERFISDSFVRQTCDREESYHKVLASNILITKRIIRDKKEISIITGPDCLDKELLYVRAVNSIVYHRLELVSELFYVAFGISIDLSQLKNSLNIRNDIIHRFGCSINGAERIITESDVLNLLVNVNDYVSSISNQISCLPEVKD